ncbi:reductase [Erysipelothrix larvae]|uniref:Reductase n=1 Tax=Erysipelothrix larvae TaxID=1514105 RepID=A0A0X8H026_9FIRM|nr:NAD(P)H-dependent oxidoreductase [Erysipelothrix larvae]AMC93593.1 reductase [Erysipelothrix larvae]
MLKIGIVIASVREGRNGKQVGDWTYNYATTEKAEEASYELVDLKDYDLPLLGLQPTQEQGAAIKAWSEKMASFDGYVFVTPEYNRALPGAFKNALDYLQPELNNKAVGYVAYGGLGGLSSIQTLRLINAEQELASVRTMVTFSIMADFVNMSEFKPNDYHKDNANKMFDQVIAWSKALKTIRG